MFSCVNANDVVPQNRRNEHDNETVDRILTEAAKLKSKCKSIRNLLLETETKRNEEKEQYERRVAELQHELENSTSALKAQHHLEVIDMNLQQHRP